MAKTMASLLMEILGEVASRDEISDDAIGILSHIIEEAEVGAEEYGSLMCDYLPELVRKTTGERAAQELVCAILVLGSKGDPRNAKKLKAA